MANEVRLDLKMTGEQMAQRGLKGVGDAADKAGDQIEGMGKDAGYLERQVKDLDGSLKDLIRQLDQSGDKTLMKDIRRAQRELRQFDRLAKEIAPNISSAGMTAGKSFADGLIDAASTAVKSGGPYVIGGLAAAAVLAAPFIGSAIGAAVLGGVGAGGIVGGIALAARDPKVKAAAEDVGKAMLASLAPIGKSFVDPVLGSLDIFKRAVADIAADAAPGMAELAKEVEPLALAFANMGKNAMPGFLEALDAAKPILRVLADELPEVGDALSEMFSSMAEGGDGAVMAFSAFMDIVKDSLILLGDLVSVAGQTYEAMVALGIAFGDMADAMPTWAKDLMLLTHLMGPLNDLLQGQADALDASSEAGDGSANVMRNLKKETAETAEQVKSLTNAVNEFLDIQMTADEAAIAWEQGLVDLKKELYEGKRVIDLHSTAGRENREALLGQIDAANDMRKAAIAQGDGTKEAMDKANEAYRSNVQQLYNMASAAGYNKQQLDIMFAPYLNGPREAVTEFRFPGLIDGLNRAYALKNVLGSLAAVNNAANGTYGGGRAGGGDTEAGRIYKVGENGPELRVERSPGYIYNANETRAMLAGSGSGGGEVMGVLHVVHQTPDGRIIREELLELKRARGLVSLGLS